MRPSSPQRCRRYRGKVATSAPVLGHLSSTQSPMSYVAGHGRTWSTWSDLANQSVSGGKRRGSNGLAAPWWGGQSPRATTLPPRRLRAALHPLRHPLEPRCARLEPRPIPLTHAPAAASILLVLTTYLRAPPCPPACGLVHVLTSPLCLAGYELARPSESPGARATSPSARPCFGVALRRAFRMLPHATTPPHIPSPYTRSRLHVLTTHADMAGTRLALAVVQAR